MNRIIMSMLNSISPTLARLYITNDFVRVNILFWVSMPITLLLFVIFGAGIVSWIPAVWISLMLITFVQGKGHSEQVSSATSVVQSNPEPSPSAPSSNPQGKVVDCKACGGTGTIEVGTELTICSKCQGHGKLRIIPRGDTPIVGTKKSSTGKWTLDDKSLRLLGIFLGIMIAALGSQVPLVGQYIALAGVGIIVASIIIFAPKKKSVVPGA